MTDRHAGYVVTLKADIRDDEAEDIINALRMVKGVISVEPVIGGTNIGEIIATSRVNVEWRSRIIRLLAESRE